MGGSESGCMGVVRKYGVRIRLYICNVKHLEVVAYGKIWAKIAPLQSILRFCALSQSIDSLRNSLTSEIVDQILPSIRVF